MVARDFNPWVQGSGFLLFPPGGRTNVSRDFTRWNQTQSHGGAEARLHLRRDHRCAMFGAENTVIEVLSPRAGHQALRPPSGRVIGSSKLPGTKVPGNARAPSGRIGKRPIRRTASAPMVQGTVSHFSRPTRRKCRTPFAGALRSDRSSELMPLRIAVGERSNQQWPYSGGSSCKRLDVTC